MKIRRFEDLKSWQSAREGNRQVSQLADQHAFDRNPKLREQVLDAADSAMANISEGHKSGSDKEFVRFLRIASRSSAEVQSHRYVALDRRYFQQGEFDKTYKECDKTKALIGGLIRYLARPRPTPPKAVKK